MSGKTSTSKLTPFQRNLQAFDFEALRDRGVRVILGTATDALRPRLTDAVPEVAVFESTLPWLQATGDEPAVGRLVVVDGTDLLASTITDDGEAPAEHAVFGTGVGNSLVVIVRRLLTMGGQQSVPAE